MMIQTKKPNVTYATQINSLNDLILIVIRTVLLKTTLKHAIFRFKFYALVIIKLR